MAKYSVGQKLAGAFSAVVVVALIGSGLSLMNFGKLNQANDWNVHSYKVLRASDALLTNMVNMETGIRGYVASGDEQFLEPYYAGKKQFDTTFELVRGLTADNADQQRRLATLGEMRAKIETVDQQLISLRKEASGSATSDSLIDYFKQGHDKQFMDKYRATAAEFNRAEEDLLASRSTDVSSLSATTKTTLLLAGLFTVLLSAGLGLAITRAIGRALGGEPDIAAGIASEIAKGNLAVSVPVSSGDTGSLMTSLEAMRARLNTIVKGIQSSSESITVAAGEIAQGNTDLSKRTEEQAASLEETAASMEELTATVKQNTENAKQANSLAGNASEVAIRGGEVVGQVVATMQEISESSGKVAEIISVIEGISFQTNILALNAAVEAARAGEQGRGFAVVAGEVRTLAQRSATAAKEIKDLIHQSVESVAQGSEQVHKAGATMDEVVRSVKRVTDIMGEITCASSEQSTGIEQVNVAVSQMDEVTQQNAALVEQASAAAQAMAEQATNLRDAIAIFRIDDARAVATPMQPVAAKVTNVNPTRKIPASNSRSAKPSVVAVQPAAPATADWQAF